MKINVRSYQKLPEVKQTPLFKGFGIKIQARA